MFERGAIERVQRATDLVALIRESRPLRRVGSRWVTKCPFHEEKTPSFSVSPEGLYHCFGCKASGDAIRFVERFEGLAFPDAVRFLAERAGIELPETRDPNIVAEDRRKRDLAARLYAACEAAAVYFEHCLDGADYSELARGALEERGVTRETATRFRLGYAPAAWGALAAHLARLGVSPADAEMAGLTLPSRGGGWHDRFRHRLMFPITDRSGRIVAFSGRVLPVSEEMPDGLVPEGAGKYVNSPKSDIYEKSEHLYGLHAARDTILKRNAATLVEGNFDVVQMHQHGFTDTVAPLGTAFTEKQAKLLRTMAERVTLLFDGDGPGREAARKSHPVCERLDITAVVGVLPKGEDPDTYLRAHGAEAMRKEISYAQGMIEWLTKDIASNAGATLSDRVGAARALAPLLASIADSITRTAAVRGAAQRLLLSEEEVRMAVKEHEFQAAQEAKGRAFPAHGKSERPGMAEMPNRNDISPRGERLARGAGIEAVLYDRTLLAGALAYELVDYLAEPAATVIRMAVAQYRETGALDGPALIAVLDETNDPGEGLYKWIAARMIPVEDAVAEHCPAALRDALDRLRRCREVRQAEEARRESARRGANGDRVGEVEALGQGRAKGGTEA